MSVPHTDHWMFVRINRYVLATLLVLLITGAAVTADAPVYTIAIGPVHANPTEDEECYWNIGYGADATMVVVHPKNMACARLRELKGKTIRLQAVVE